MDTGNTVEGTGATCPTVDDGATSERTVPAARVEAFLASLPAALSREGENPATVRQVAARIRAELALAAKSGALPEGTECSVRCLHHTSIRVEITAWRAGPVFSGAYTETLMDPSRTWEDRRIWSERRRCWSHGRNAELLLDALWTIERIADRHNYDRSDLMTDYFNVGYYLHVSADPIEARVRHNLRVESDPAFAKLVHDAAEAARVIGPNAARAVCRGGVDAASEWQLERLIKLGKIANGRPLVYNKRFGRWVSSDGV